MSRAVLFRLDPPLQWCGANFLLAVGQPSLAAWVREAKAYYHNAPTRHAIAIHCAFMTPREAVDELERLNGFALVCDHAMRGEYDDPLDNEPKALPKPGKSRHLRLVSV